MKLYESSAFPIRDDLRAAHETAWSELGQSGTWWTGAERVAIAAEARNARLSAGQGEGEPAAVAIELPGPLREVCHQLGADPAKMARGRFDRAVPAAVEEAPYVEAVGVIARSVCIDTYCRGIGQPLPAFVEGSQSAPTHESPGELVRDESAWVATLPEGTPEGATLYGGPTVNVVRALSQVPAEVRAWMAVAGTQYVHVSVIGDMDEPGDRAIDRAQVELVAGRVSALNECFY